MDRGHIDKFKAWQADWNLFVRDVLHARLDAEQQRIVTSVQFNPMTAVASGTARGKDYVAACVALCFLYLTPKFGKDGRLIENTKVALTAPTARQVSNIMTPEVRRLFRSAVVLPGRTVANDIRTEYEEWFLTGFKASDDNTEAWSGFHATNTMFCVTEASGLSEKTFHAIEGNLQGNSRLLIVFNPNVSTGYAAQAMKSPRFHKFRLNSLNAENVVRKKIVIPGQVDYEWVSDKVRTWCTPLSEGDEVNEGEGDFLFEGRGYRPNDLFRVKVLGMFPRVSDDTLIPYEWVELANRRHQEILDKPALLERKRKSAGRYGVDVAGMGRDSSVIIPRYDDFVDDPFIHQSGGEAGHMKIAGRVAQLLSQNPNSLALIDTIGEGAGVYARLAEQGYHRALSCKFSESAGGLRDVTNVYEFVNMRAFLFWALRDWLNPANGLNACLPICDQLAEELTEIKWSFSSSGKIQIEAKEDLKKRLRRSPDLTDALANTFYPRVTEYVSDEDLVSAML